MANENINHRHKWLRDNHSGKVDTTAVDIGDIHNGPVCVSCGDYFCEHCVARENKDYLTGFNVMTCQHDNGLDDKPYTDSDF